ncbi:MAG: M23 family metallopeptidase [Salinibacterium sp.]|nr:M23 family metallopeptidase [Salinibacterium sp.]
MSRSARRAIAKSVQSTGGKSRTSVARKLASVVALAFAGTLVVAVSIPSNLFMTDASAVAEDAAVVPVEGQSLQVSADARAATTARDSFEAISYAQALALKYAGVDYSYAVTSGAVRWPFPYAVPITDGFGPRDGGFHKGVDFVPGAGTPIYAIADGIATTATYDNSGYGQHVVLQHNLGGVDVESLYGHMIAGSSPIVVGQAVKVGDFLGLVGDTGIAYGAHLHFEIHIDKVPVDPFAWLQANAVN